MPMCKVAVACGLVVVQSVFPALTRPQETTRGSEDTAGGWAAYEENRSVLAELALTYADLARLSLPQGAVLCAPFRGTEDLESKLNSTAAKACEALQQDQWQAVVAGQYLATAFRSDATATFRLAQEEAERAEAALAKAAQDARFVGTQPGPRAADDGRVSIADAFWSVQKVEVMDPEFMAIRAFYKLSPTEVGVLFMFEPANSRTYGLGGVTPAKQPRRVSLGERLAFAGSMGNAGVQLAEIWDNHVIATRTGKLPPGTPPATVYRIGLSADGTPLPISRPTPAEVYLQERLVAARALMEYCRGEHAKGQRTVHLVGVGGLVVPRPGPQRPGGTMGGTGPSALEELGEGTLGGTAIGCRSAVLCAGDMLLKDQGGTGATADQVRELVHQVVFGARAFGVCAGRRYAYVLPLRVAAEALEGAAPELMRSDVPAWALEAARMELSFPPAAAQLGYRRDGPGAAERPGG